MVGASQEVSVPQIVGVDISEDSIKHEWQRSELFTFNLYFMFVLYHFSEFIYGYQPIKWADNIISLVNELRTAQDFTSTTTQIVDGDNE